ncbi:MAG: acetyl-CoA carboxylase biotin carboxyl carrier protein [Phycisphaerae bacterium]|nr:acetyl-CoA carboxylase biotin carboxyl carrier protein [Phycisphaerae bacterium]
MGHTMIDIRKLKELVRLMVDNDLSELNLEDQAETVTIKRALGAGPGGAGAPIVHHAPVIGAPPATGPAADGSSGGGSAGSEPAASGARPEAADSDAGLLAIESPMVGTCYLSPNPDSPPYVKAGATIDADTVVCLVEAMKVFNEIKSEVSGTIERVLIKNGQAIEYGQKLFLVRPS